MNIKWKLCPFCSAPHLFSPNYWNLFLLSRSRSFIYWQRFHQQKPLGRGDGGCEAAETSLGAPHICLLDNKGTKITRVFSSVYTHKNKPQEMLDFPPSHLPPPHGKHVACGALSVGPDACSAAWAWPADDESSLEEIYESARRAPGTHGRRTLLVCRHKHRKIGNKMKRGVALAGKHLLSV